MNAEAMFMEPHHNVHRTSAAITAPFLLGGSIRDVLAGLLGALPTLSMICACCLSGPLRPVATAAVSVLSWFVSSLLVYVVLRTVFSASIGIRSAGIDVRAVLVAKHLRFDELESIVVDSSSVTIVPLDGAKLILRRNALSLGRFGWATQRKQDALIERLQIVWREWHIGTSTATA